MGHGRAVIVLAADEEEPGIVAQVVGLDDAGLAEAVPVKGIVVVDKQDPRLRKGAVDDADGLLDAAVHAEDHAVHPAAQVALELGPAPPHAERVVVARGRVGVEEARVAGDGDGEPGPLLPADAVENLHDEQAQAAVKLGAGNLRLGAAQRGVACARVERVEAEDAAVHNVKEAQVVAADGEEGKVGRAGRAEEVDLGAVAAGEDIVNRGPGARQVLEADRRVAVGAVLGSSHHVVADEDGIGVAAEPAVDLGGAVGEAGADAGRVRVAESDEAGRGGPRAVRKVEAVDGLSAAGDLWG